ncbi:hypothetical protein M0812_00042 [Anaeramoeba flamelloides]|uniref:PSI domain-containing protein n=1 Tax=Anaeramoeba flamelloides TaxID=1746091 RepID=A0AAV7ZZY3_9EUKA|nr:hypothetical protein M0812_00042 [Anaeramoeba flamelloides]
MEIFKSLIFFFVFASFSNCFIHKLTDPVCNFLSGDDCLKCEDQDTQAFYRYCGKYCTEYVDGEKIYSCTTQISCVQDPPLCQEPEDCSLYSGENNCFVCFYHGCKWNQFNYECNLEGGTNFTSTVFNCPSSNKDASVCKGLYSDYDECSRDSDCLWIWVGDSRGPECAKNEVQPVNVNTYEDNNNMCEYRENCDECHNAGCTWCYNSDHGFGFCVYSNETSSNLECNTADIITTDQSCPTNEDHPDNYCNDKNSCSNCTDTLNCIWCFSNGQGYEGRCQGDTIPCSLPEQSVADSDQCPNYLVETCGKVENCSQCTTITGCNWCALDPILHTGECLYDNQSPSFDQCLTEKRGKWDSNCQAQSDCLSYSNCSDCRVNANCSWCYYQLESTQCVESSDCVAKDGIEIETCNDNFEDDYNCTDFDTCSDCFINYPWCKWAYTGDNYENNGCYFWDSSEINLQDSLVVGDCEDITLCSERSNCSYCVSSEDGDNIECVWCYNSETEKGECYLEKNEPELTCSKNCVDDDTDSSVGYFLNFNIFLWVCLLF